jgi:hypothetical protein
MAGWAERSSEIKAGDSVAYSRRFLQSTGQYTGDAPLARGRVLGLKTLGGVVLAEVEWDRPDLPGKVDVKNLSVVRNNVVMDRD